MRDRDRRTAELFHIVDRCEKLEEDLLKIEYLCAVDLDLDGFYDNMHQVIVLVEYDIPVALDNIPVALDNYFEERRKFLGNVVSVAKRHGLTRTEDSIEDYGAHFYFVFRCSKDWEGGAENA